LQKIQLNKNIVILVLIPGQFNERENVDIVQLVHLKLVGFDVFMVLKIQIMFFKVKKIEAARSPYRTSAMVSQPRRPRFVNHCRPLFQMSWDSSVGIALGYGLDDWGSRVQFPAGAGSFSLHHCI
jgi:hypothetical protein